MKKITSIILLLSAFGFGPSREELEQQQRQQLQQQQSTGAFIRIGAYEIPGSGVLYVYKLGEDTIYWAEGSIERLPISVSVK